MLGIPLRAGFPINMPTDSDNASTLSRYLHVKRSTSTSNLGLMTPRGPLHSRCLIVCVFIRLNKCILQALLNSLERSFKHQRLTSSGVLGQPQKQENYSQRKKNQKIQAQVLHKHPLACICFLE